jgi:hypothetical protein
VLEPTAKYDGARSCQLAKVAAGIGVVDDGVDGGALAEPGHPEVRPSGPRCCPDRIVRRYPRLGQHTDLGRDPAARP